MQAAFKVTTTGNITTVDFAGARKARDFEKALAEAKRPRRVTKATRRAQRAQAVRLAAHSAL